MAGTRAFAAYINELAVKLGLYVDIQSEVFNGVEQANILIRPNQARPEVEFLLQAHMDTVEPGPFQLWAKNSSNPFEATIMDGNIYGLGSADTKLDFLCKLLVLAELKDRKTWTMPPVLVGTFGEELGMLGALKVIRKNKVNAKMALIGEPSDLKLVTSGLGHASVEIRIPFSEEETNYHRDHDLRESTSTESKLFTGAVANNQSPTCAIRRMLDYLLKMPSNLALLEVDGGVSANSIASNAFLEIDLVTMNNPTITSKVSSIYSAILKLEEEFKTYTDPAFKYPHPTLNIGMIRTQGEFVFIHGTCRMPPIITQAIYEKWIAELSAVCTDNKGELKVLDYKKPFRTPLNSIFVKGCQDVLKKYGPLDGTDSENICVSQATANEASIFSRTGIECVCFGPGKREGNVFTPDEHVALADLDKASEFYREIISRFCF